MESNGFTFFSVMIEDLKYLAVQLNFKMNFATETDKLLHFIGNKAFMLLPCRLKEGLC